MKLDVNHAYNNNHIIINQQNRKIHQKITLCAKAQFFIADDRLKTAKA